MVEADGAGAGVGAGGFSSRSEGNNSALHDAAIDATKIVHVADQGTTRWTAEIKTLDADGFTLTWAASTPAAACNFVYICLP